MPCALLLIPCLGLPFCPARAQADTAFAVSGYAEVYYCYDLAEPPDGLRAGPFYNYKRHNEVNLNLGYVKLSYSDSTVRGKMALMAGTYPQYNLSGEEPLISHVLEANVGLRLSRTREWWLDAGILPSHIGFESAVGQDSWNLSRSLLAENSPYYEAGARLGYTSPNGKWYGAVLWLNGWQTVRRSDHNTLSGGTQLTWKPDGGTALNWSTYFGSGSPGTQEAYRLYNNLYAQLRTDRTFALTLGFDLGWQQDRGSDTARTWFSPVVIPRVRLGAHRYLALRLEYYDDRDEVLISTGTPLGFRALGLSLNYDHWLRPNVLWRVECRTLHGREAIFQLHEEPSTDNAFFTTSLSIRLGKG